MGLIIHSSPDSLSVNSRQPHTLARATSCGCRHRVIFESPEDVSALCDGEESGCEPILLEANDLIVYALDGKALAAAIRIATRDYHVVRTQPVARRFANCARSLCVWHAFTTSIYDELPI
jgi:hypothetical protein